MEIVTIAVAMAAGATLASLASVLIAVIKKITSTQNGEDKIVVSKFDYKEISDLTTEELDQIINDLEHIKLNRLRTASGN